MRGKILGILVGFGFLILLASSSAYSEVRQLDLSRATGNMNAAYYSSMGGWGLAKTGGWSSIQETLNDLNQGSFEGTKLNSDGKVVLDLGRTLPGCTGNFISRVFDLSQTAGDEMLSYNLYVPSGTSGGLSVRHGNSIGSLSDWAAVPNSNYPIRDIIGSSRYLQYRLVLNGNSQCTSTPIFGGITLNWLRYSTSAGVVGTVRTNEIRGALLRNISVLESKPQGTDIRWAVSEDNGTTYKKYSGGAWVRISSIINDGNTTSELMSIPRTAWSGLSADPVRIYFAMKTDVGYLTPLVSSVQVDFDAPSVSITSFTCTDKLFPYLKGRCQISARSNVGNVGYELDGPSDMEVDYGEEYAEILFTTAGRKTVRARAMIWEIPSVYAEAAKTVDVVAPPKPKVIINGPKGVWLGESADYSAEVQCPEKLKCSFRFVLGDKVYESTSFSVLFGEVGKYAIVGQAWDPDIPDSMGETTLSVFVSEVPKPYVTLSVPKKVELGVPFAAASKMTAKYGVPKGYWILPDGSRVEGGELTYTARQKRDDLTFKYVAYVEGFPYTETTVESSPIKVDVYEMPEFKIRSYQKLDKSYYAPYTAFFGVTGDMKGPREFGVSFTHRWDFGDGTVVDGEEPGRAGHTYTEGGTYTVRLTVFDDRGNSSSDSVEISIVDPPPMAVGPFSIIASNKHLRAPVKIIAKPVVTGGHPSLDKVTSYEWRINGQVVSSGRLLSVTFNEPGDYIIGLAVGTKSGKIVEGSQIISVNPNQLPECAISYQDYPKYKYTKISASCRDPDGKVKAYLWDLGDGSTDTKPNTFAKYQASGTYIVSLTVTDDSGESAVFSAPVAVER